VSTFLRPWTAKRPSSGQQNYVLQPLSRPREHLAGAFEGISRFFAAAGLALRGRSAAESAALDVATDDPEARYAAAFLEGANSAAAGAAVGVREAYVAGAALAESEAKFRMIANGVPVMGWSAAADGVTDFYNDRWYEFTGATLGSTDGAGWFDMLHPDDRAAATSAFQQCVASGEAYEVEYRLLHHTGQYRCVLARALPVRDQGGQILRWMGACIDIQNLTDSQRQKEAAIANLESREAQLQSILSAVPEGMIVVGEDGIIVSFSAAAERQFGWTASDAIGVEISKLMPQTHRKEDAAYLSPDPDTGQSVRRISRVGVGERRDGTTFPMELVVGEMRAADRRYFTTFVTDLTERQAVERRFSDLQSQLFHASRVTAMGEMASALAHELNQPLTASASYVQGSLRLLEQEPQDKAIIKDALGHAAGEMLRAGDIIRRMRDFVSKGQTDQRSEGLTQLLEEAAALAMVGAREQSVRLRFAIDPAIGAVVVDKVQIQQVLVNLMRNAIEAMAAGPIRDLTVGAQQVSDHMVEVSIADTGTGISTDIAARLFQPFVTTKPQGMGVGLSISRTIIEAHGGRIWAEPAGAGGTVFRFTLRAAPKESAMPDEGD